MADAEKIPTSRVRRTATVGRLAASEAVKQFGTRAANLTRDERAAEDALARRQLETAKQIVGVLGTMKGAAMKLGQVMSFLDVGLVPEEFREEFQHELAKLRDAAPTVSFKQMRKVIEADLGEPLKNVFSSFEEEPIAAASIGQVYEATLRDDGRRVAVKVQYPGVAAAVRADMQNLDMIMRLLKRMTPQLDVKAIAAEVRGRIVEELDYELEAQNQRSLHRIYDGHPFIFVPEIVGELTRERVLVSELVSGVGFEELKKRPRRERDRLGEIVFRFFLGCLYRHHQFSGDPHPGNFLLLEDGRVAFLDFGLFKRMDGAAVELELACQRAVVEHDAARLHRLLAASGFLPNPERVDADHLLAYVEDAIWWYTTDQVVQLTPEIATQVLIESSDPRSTHFREMRH
ncbi:MAG: ABC1 kinase family protein, partial [Solirubrobacteraceae bacterium]